MDGYFSKQLAYGWVLTVHRYLPTSFYTCMRRSLYKVSSKQARNTSHNNSISPIDIQMMYFLRKTQNLEFIYPCELEIKETMETAASSSSLDCYLYIDNRKLTTRLYDKRDDFNFPIVNFPFLSSNIPSAPAYDVYVSQLIHYTRACSNYKDFMEHGKVLTTKLLNQGYQTRDPRVTGHSPE